MEIKYIMFKIVAFNIKTLFTRLYVRVGISLTCGKHLYDYIIWLRRGWVATWNYFTSLPFIEVPEPTQEKGRSCICKLGYRFYPLSTTSLLACGTVPIVWYFWLFILFNHITSHNLYLLGTLLIWFSVCFHVDC